MENSSSPIKVERAPSGDAVAELAVKIKQDSIIKQGTLRKKGYRTPLYRKRNIVLTKEGELHHTSSATEQPLKLTGDVKVSTIESSTIRGGTGFSHPNQFVFSVACAGETYWFAAESMGEAEAWKQAIETFASTAATAAAAGGKSIAGKNVTFVEQENADSLAEGQGKKLSTSRPTDGDYAADKRSKVLTKMMKSPGTELVKKGQFSQALTVIAQAHWQEAKITNGIRIMQEVGLEKEYPCLKASIVLPASPERVFAVLNDLQLRSKWDGDVLDISLISAASDGHNRKYHVKTRAKKLNAAITAAPRDYAVESSWRRESDGSFIILEQSVANYPTKLGFVRANIFGLGFTICPRRFKKFPISSLQNVLAKTGFADAAKELSQLGTSVEDGDDDDSDGDDSNGRNSKKVTDDDCLLQVALHADCGGWISKVSKEWNQEWVYSMILRLLGLREYLEAEKYKTYDFDQLEEEGASEKQTATKLEQQDGKIASDNSNNAKTTTNVAGKGEEVKRKLAATPRGSTIVVRNNLSDASDEMEKEIVVEATLPRECYSDATDPFKVRGNNYFADKVKITSSAPMFQLVAMDLLEVPAHIDHIALNWQKGPAYKYLQAPEKKRPFMFIVQFQIPGPPNYAFIGYFCANPNVLEQDTPFSRLFKRYMDGTDEFRDKHFKLIPRVVKGNFMVKKAIGQTPAILGTKLAQLHFSGPGYYEVDVDIGSSSAAGGILGVVKAYTKSLTIDLAFLLESQQDDELPEAILAAMQFHGLELSMAKKIETVQ